MGTPLCLLQVFQVQDEGVSQGLVRHQPLVRTRSFEPREERRMLCDPLNSSANNSQCSLNSCYFPASTPVAAPPQPPRRVRAVSPLHFCFHPGFFLRLLLPIRDPDAPVGSSIQTRTGLVWTPGVPNFRSVLLGSLILLCCFCSSSSSPSQIVYCKDLDSRTNGPWSVTAVIIDLLGS